MPGHHTRTVAAMLGLIVSAACTYQPSRFPIYGSIDTRSRLAGEWTGEFTGAGIARSGSITFQLEPGGDSASGDVSVDPFYLGQQTRHHEQRNYPGASARPVLRVRHLRASASIVEGMLQPYYDPDCDCVLTTSFHGVIRGDSIMGAYVSRSGWTVREGAWRVTRRAESHAAR